MDMRFTTTTKLSIILAIVFLGISVTTLSGTRMTQRVAADGVGQRSGAAVFSQMCVRCHGADGRADTRKGRAVGATDLTSNDWRPDTARDTRIVNKGKEAMPAFKGRLKPAEIDAVVAYIPRFKN